MRFLFKTAYEQDIRLFRDGTTAMWYGLLAVAVLLLPALLSSYYVGEITWVFIYGICGISLMVLVGYTGLLSLGHAAFLGIGAYAHAYFLEHGMPWVASVALAILITTACGIVVGLPALRMSGIYLAIATLAFAVIIQEVFTRWEAVTKGFAGMALSHQYLSIIAGTLILCGLLYAFFTYTRIGIAMQATSQNQLAAYYMGIPVKLIFSLVWAISAAVATAAGILLAPVTLIDINMGLYVALKAVAAAVLGGFGSIPGALVGGITIGLIELYAGATLPEGFKDTAPYIVLLLMLAVRPQGLFGTLGRKRV